MRLYYFIGGPKDEYQEEFFRRLRDLGGVPAGWQIYPHKQDDGKALHIVQASTLEEVIAHLRHFDGIYDHSEIVEILAS